MIAMLNMFKRMACGGHLFHLHGHDNQVMICRPCNDQRILELECALEAALKTIVAIDERKATIEKC